ncbi:GNAT family N-acetyltransferase [Chengkuizengella axinellae]|uniref:GNAT family N-acetyltransferase n=1 Tax=Chengkuizengella axinellae TaxID=3064388 RepID=A0ABT9J321_9BACL|nr:GNAT family N-acetyltransferase [Chengkuizengella sp. 2205SS18-9]MDP5275997.1 GNAT family N-acetyltransferase [Chengkuizengella sp. 2205SS18-9]
MTNLDREEFMIETNRLILREFNEIDLDELYTLVCQNDFMLTVSKKEDLKRYIKYLKEKQNQFNPDDTRFILGIFVKDKPEFVGWSAILPNTKFESTQRERFIVISRDQRNKGYVTEAEMGTYDYMFTKTNHHEIVARVYFSNPYYKLVTDIMKKTGYVPMLPKYTSNTKRCNYFILTRERYMSKR